MIEEFDLRIVPSETCAHLNLHVEHETSILEYCPKGCDGVELVDILVRCKDCGQVIHEEHTGHEGCKYGR